MTDHPPRTEDNSPSLSQPSKRKHEPELGGDAAVLHLVECLGSEDIEVRQTAAFRLAAIGDSRAIETLMFMLEVSGDERPVKALANIGLPALPYLADLLGHDNWYVAYHAAQGLVRLGDNGIAEAVQLSQSENLQVRWNAIIALEQVHYPHNTPTAAFIETFYMWNHPITVAAVHILGDRSDYAVVPQLRSLMDNEENGNVRYLAAASLALMGFTDGVELLIPGIRASLSELVKIAWPALEKLGEKAFPFLAAELGKAENDELEAMREHRHVHILELLETMKNPDAIPVIEVGLKSSFPYVRQEAIRILGNYADARSTEALTATLEDEDRDIQYDASRALLKIGTPEAREAVSKWLRSLPRRR